MGAHSSQVSSYSSPNLADAKYYSINDYPNQINNHFKRQDLYKKKIIKTPFYGVWSIAPFVSISPSPRTGHFTIFDEDNGIIYIGYGTDKHGVPLNDVWKLDINTLKWSKIELYGKKVLGRSGTNGCLIGNKIVLFGGYAQQKYYSDLHEINVTNGETKKIHTKGEKPDKRSSPVVAFYDGNLYVWGGFNGKWPTELSVLDLKNRKWTQYEQGVNGKTSVPYVYANNNLYIYVGAISGGLYKLDFNENKICVQQTYGTEPNCSVVGSGMIKIENYLIVLGGKSKENWTLSYACDLRNMRWFVFYILPDEITLSVNDGYLNENGVFMLPKIYSFSFCYLKNKKQIIGFLGYPMREPSYLFYVNIANALSVLHLQDDMIAMFSFI